MAEKVVQSLPQNTPSGKDELGKIEVAPEVIEVIAGIATTEVEGVSKTRGNFATGVVEKFGKKVHGKGIKTEWTEEGLIVDVYCFVQYGVSVAKVAKQVQTQIREAIANMTSHTTKEVNVHITGILFDQVNDAKTDN
ncbi:MULTISPECIES: Asp23/Gls24 family envelope stress response protein [unclassified Rummeliibacillus]|uniref:Asp23/Gls24 family envelope stress response protein n=1 Tax=unclassified Rummeliibacillus TaxID=2622809 RepID=UPI000E66E623|nr:MULTISPECIES: Asp23/Gls24 family envelope stress response protein [unclassified Rummeliibacillus]RIJ63980.1 Asp23/Gls24 family envelope stress response protein [Rummeliibacillus sp. POC4]RPJ94867.1 Asp23/Gls24 family envelope stress response protein [Rummeliibacillus sp. TYF005]